MNNIKEKINSYRNDLAAHAAELARLRDASELDYKKRRAEIERAMLDKYVDDDCDAQGLLPENDIDVSVDLDRLLGIEIDQDEYDSILEEYGKVGTGVV